MFSKLRLGFALAVCALFSSAPAAEQAPAGMTVDKEKKTITIDAKVAPRKLAKYDQIYPIEVIACWPDPKGQKAHETIVTFDIKPSDVHKALESMGLKPGKPAKGEVGEATGPELKIFLEVPGSTGQPRKVAIEKTLIDKKTNLAMPPLKFYFTGSVITQPNPDKPDKVYAADNSGTLITVFPVSDETVIQTNLSAKDEPLLKMETDKKILPPEGTPVKLIIQVK